MTYLNQLGHHVLFQIKWITEISCHWNVLILPLYWHYFYTMWAYTHSNGSFLKDKKKRNTRKTSIIKESHIYMLQFTFFFLFFCRLWPHPSPVSQMGRSRTNCSRCLCMPGSAGHAVCYSRIHNVPWYSGGQIIQPRTLLHHSGWHLLGLLVHFLSDCKASTDLLLPSANWHRPLTGYELFCSGN